MTCMGDAHSETLTNCGWRNMIKVFQANVILWDIMTSLFQGKSLWRILTDPELNWTINEIINAKQTNKKGTKFTSSLKNVFFQVINEIPDYKCRNPQSKGRWRRSLEMNRCEETEKEGAIGMLVLQVITQSGSMTCFFLYPMPR